MVSLLSDFGLVDGFVGALHSVLRARLPAVPIVDLTHDIPAQDVRAGSLALKRAAPYLAAGVVVAVVDPGVGTRRRAVAVQARAADIIFVGPDNGLLLPALEALGGAGLAVELENRGYWLPAPGPTFAGRDVFAPAAAHLAGGGDIAALGRKVGPEALVRLPAPVCRKCPDGSLEAEVTWVDRYGNVQLAAGPSELGDLAPGAELLVTSSAGRHWRTRMAHTYGDLAPGELGVLVDSYGSLALCLNGASAADLLGAEDQDVLVINWRSVPDFHT